MASRNLCSLSLIHIHPLRGPFTTMPMQVRYQHGDAEVYWCFQPQHRAFSLPRPTTPRPMLATSADQAVQSLSQNASSPGYVMAANRRFDRCALAQIHGFQEAGKAGDWNRGGH